MSVEASGGRRPLRPVRERESCGRITTSLAGASDADARSARELTARAGPLLKCLHGAVRGCAAGSVALGPTWAVDSRGRALGARGGW